MILQRKESSLIRFNKHACAYNSVPAKVMNKMI
jgi:hypothetical protein